ncbi:glycosyl transferase group 1 [Bacteroides sp. CAG:443]|nr:glycosyl transferase group 1 [Bacteroides sp. CAG:443]
MKDIAIFVKNLTSGGAEKQSVLLAKALSGYYQIHYIIFNGNKIHPKYMDLLKEDPRIQIQSFIGGHLSRYNEFVTYLQKNNIRVIFSYLTAANFYACMAGRKVNAKVFTGLRNAQLPLLKCWADKLLTNSFAEKAISNSYSGKENFITKGFKSEKIIVIPNCFEHIKDYTQKKRKDKVHIITVGRFVPQKDYETAIHAIAKLKKTYDNIVFDIVGYGNMETQVRKWIRQYVIDDITTIYINPNNIAELLDQADIYISTSLFEGTSNSIMEAMNADLPIVATNVGDNGQLVQNQKNGFVTNKKDWKDIASKLAILIDNEELSLNMGKQSKLFLSNNYSVEQFRKSYLSILSSIE